MCCGCFFHLSWSLHCACHLWLPLIAWSLTGLLYHMQSHHHSSRLFENICEFRIISLRCSISFSHLHLYGFLQNTQIQIWILQLYRYRHGFCATENASLVLFSPKYAVVIGWYRFLSVSAIRVHKQPLASTVNHNNNVMLLYSLHTLHLSDNWFHGST